MAFDRWLDSIRAEEWAKLGRAISDLRTAPPAAKHGVGSSERAAVEAFCDFLLNGGLEDTRDLHVKEFERIRADERERTRKGIAAAIRAQGEDSGVGAYGDYGPPAIAVEDAEQIAERWEPES